MKNIRLIGLIGLMGLVAVGFFLYQKLYQSSRPISQPQTGKVSTIATLSAPAPKLTNTPNDPNTSYQYQAQIAPNTQALFSQKGTDKPSYEIKKDNYFLKFTLDESAKVIKAEEDTIEYAVTILGIPMTLRHTVSPTGIKEEFIIDKKPDLTSPTTPNTLTIPFQVESNGLKIKDDGQGTYTFTDAQGQVVWSIEPPTLKDAQGKSGEIKGELKDNFYTLTLASSFLLQASYPIVIDPTVVVNTTSDTGTGSGGKKNIVETSDGTLHTFQQVGTQTATCGGQSKSGLLWFNSTDSGSTWTCQGQLSSNTTNLMYADAVKDSSDNIYVIYSVATTGRNDAYDVFYQKLTKGAGATWTLEAAQTALDGSGTGTGYHYAVLEIEGTTRLWLATRYQDGTNYQIAVYYSDGFSATPTWTASSTALATAYSSSGDYYPYIVRFGSKIGVVYKRSVNIYLRFRADTDSLTSWSTEDGPGTGAYPVSGEYNAIGDASGKIYIPHLCLGIGGCIIIYNGSTWQERTVPFNVYGNPIALSTDGTNLWFFAEDTAGLSGHSKLIYKKVTPPSSSTEDWSAATPVASYHGVFDKYWSYVASVYLDDTTDAGNTTSADTQMITSTDDIAYFGKSEIFDAVAWNLSTNGVGGTATWEYCSAVDVNTACTTWSALTFTASSNTNLTADGWGVFTAPGDWVAAKVNSEGTAYYYIRARATGNYTTSSPVGLQMASMPGINSYSVTPAVSSNKIHAVWTENASSPVRIRYAAVSVTASTAPAATSAISPTIAAYSSTTWATYTPTMKHLVRTSNGTLHAFVQGSDDLVCGPATTTNNNKGLTWLYSTDSGSTWTCGGQLDSGINTSTVNGNAMYADARVDSFDNIYVVYSSASYPRNNTDDVFYRKLTYDGSSWTLGAAQTVLDGSSSTTAYHFAGLELEGTTRLWLATRYADATNYGITVYYSDGLSASPTWTESVATLDTAGTSSSWHRPTIVRYGSNIGVIYADQGSGGDLKWRNRADSDGLTTWNAEATISTTFSINSTNFATVSDSSGNIYLAANDGTIVYFTFYNGSSWSSLATVSSAAASDQYVTLATDNTSVWVVYGETTGLAGGLTAMDMNKLVYKKGVSPFATANFDTNSTAIVSQHTVFDKVWTYISSAYTDDTTDAGDTGSADVAMPAGVGDIIYFGMDEKFDAVSFDVSTSGAAGIVAWEYYNGSSWMPLTTYFAYSNKSFDGDGYVTFNPHTDWATTQINGEGTAYYYVRARVTTAYTTTPVGVEMTAIPTINYASAANTIAGVFVVWTENNSDPQRVRYQTILSNPIKDILIKGTTKIQGTTRISN